MKTLWLAKQYVYDGSQLRSLFGYLEHGILGDSIVAWQGPCQIDFDHMVDGEDLLAKSQICGADMVHFIVEKFASHLEFAVALQRIMASLTIDILRGHTARASLDATKLTRDGDDVFCDKQKLSISIATVSPVSALVHFAVNARNEGTPVPTCALADFGIQPAAFAQELLSRFKTEVESIEQATKKVRWVK